MNINEAYKNIVLGESKKQKLVGKSFFHGTSEDNKEEILMKGFTYSYYQQQSYWGNGIYFYDNPNDAKFYGDTNVEVKIISDKNIRVYGEWSDFVSDIVYWNEEAGDAYGEMDQVTFSENYINPYIDEYGIEGIYVKEDGVLVVYTDEIIKIVG